MLEQRASYTAALATGDDVGVADQLHVADRLDAHDSQQLAAVVVARERDAGSELGLELLRGHIWLVPAVGGDDAAVGLGGGVHDRQNRLPVLVAPGAGPGPAGGETLPKARTTGVRAIPTARAA